MRAARDLKDMVSKARFPLGNYNPYEQSADEI